MNYTTKIFGYVWILTWFLSIWVNQYRGQLFFTGVLSLFLALVLNGASKSKEVIK